MTRLQKLFGRSTSSAEIADIESTAADWVVRRDRGLGPAEQQALAEWQSADPRHAEALAGCDGAWQTLNRPRSAGRAPSVIRAIARRKVARHRRWRRIASSSVACAAVLLLAGSFFEMHRPAELAVPTRTVVLRPDRQVLSDGSSVELNTDAEIAVAFTGQSREVRLLRGEALFSVVHDSARPFVVNLGDVLVRAVGTAFVVRRDSANVDVLVTEGWVAVERAADGRSLIEPGRGSEAPASAPSVVETPVLGAGHRLAFALASTSALAAPARVSAAEIGAALTWRHHRVEFTRTTLAEAVAFFNRTNHVQIVLGDSATGELRISGIFWTNNPEGFSRLLVSSLGLGATRTRPDAIVLSK